MAMPTPLTPDELERLVADLEAGVYDDKSSVPLDIEPAQAQKFADLKAFDVRAWAERKGIKLKAD